MIERLADAQQAHRRDSIHGVKEDFRNTVSTPA
jgi:hypothetical protein